MWDRLTTEKLNQYFPHKFWVDFINYLFDQNMEEGFFWGYKREFAVDK